MACKEEVYLVNGNSWRIHVEDIEKHSIVYLGMAKHTKIVTIEDDREPNSGYRAAEIHLAGRTTTGELIERVQAMEFTNARDMLSAGGKPPVRKSRYYVTDICKNHWVIDEYEKRFNGLLIARLLRKPNRGSLQEYLKPNWLGSSIYCKETSDIMSAYDEFNLFMYGNR